MAKKNSKANFSIWSLPVLAGIVFLIVAACVPIFKGVLKVLSTQTETGYGLFNESAANLTSGVCSTLVSVFIVIALVLAAIYLALFVMDFLKVGKAQTLNSIRKIVSLLAIGLFIAILICGIVFISGNQHELAELASGANVAGGLGFYFSLVGTALFGVFGLMEAKRK